MEDLVEFNRIFLAQVYASMNPMMLNVNQRADPIDFNLLNSDKNYLLLPLRLKQGADVVGETSLEYEVAADLVR